MPSVIAMLETTPPDNSGQVYKRESRELRVEADTYEQGRDQLMAQVPDGWRIMWFRSL